VSLVLHIDRTTEKSQIKPKRAKNIIEDSNAAIVVSNDKKSDIKKDVEAQINLNGCCNFDVCRQFSFLIQRKTVKKGLIFTHYFKSTVHNGGKVVSLFWSLWLFLKTFVKIRLSTAHLITTGLVHAVQKKK